MKPSMEAVTRGEYHHCKSVPLHSDECITDVSCIYALKYEGHVPDRFMMYKMSVSYFVNIGCLHQPNSMMESKGSNFSSLSVIDLFTIRYESFPSKP